jgi:hypothetical protein
LPLHQSTILQERDSGNGWADRVGCIAWQLARLRQLHVTASRVHLVLASFEQLATSFYQGTTLVHVADEFQNVLAPQTSGGWRLEAMR